MIPGNRYHSDNVDENNMWTMLYFTVAVLKLYRVHAVMAGRMMHPRFAFRIASSIAGNNGKVTRDVLQSNPSHTSHGKDFLIVFIYTCFVWFA